MRLLALGAVAFCIAVGLWIGGSVWGTAYGVAVALIEALVVGVFVTAVRSGRKLVAAAAAFLALAVIAAPIACVTSQAAGTGDAETSCTSLVGLPPAIGLLVMVVAPVTAWMLVARRKG